jgi:hypothetical protein
MDPTQFLSKLLDQCPSYRSHLPDCPLNEIRAAPGSMRAQVEALSDGDADDLVRRHFLCVCRKNGCEID